MVIRVNPARKSLFQFFIWAWLGCAASVTETKHSCTAGRGAIKVREVLTKCSDATCVIVKVKGR